MGRILVVDDDQDILKIAQEVLAEAGHIVYVAEDAIRAMEFLNRTEFDLVLSDANMPHHSGFDFIKTLRQHERFQELSIAMLTGLRERKDIERALKMGVDDYIVKPIDPLILIQKVESLFQKRPPPTYPEIPLRGTNMGKGSVSRAVTVEAISELGARVICDYPIQNGEVLELNCDFFKALEVKAPTMKVLNVKFDPEARVYRAQMIFVGAGEALLQKIRRWLYSHGGSNRPSL